MGRIRPADNRGGSRASAAACRTLPRAPCGRRPSRSTRATRAGRGRTRYRFRRSVAKHLGSGHPHTSILGVVGLHSDSGAELESRVTHHPWPGARPSALTPCRCADSASVTRSRSTSMMDRPTPQALRWRTCTGAVAPSSSGGVCTPASTRWPACRIGIGRPVAEHTSAPPPPPQPRRGRLATGAVGLSSSCG